jgi:hypothetical protein
MGKASRSPAPVSILESYPVEMVPLASLRPHPRNYRTHPADQLAHLVQSIREHGLYRNIVIARDNTILAGHGVALACGDIGMDSVPVRRLPVDPESPQALKILAGDNSISHLAEVDDRAFTEILKEIHSLDSLLGTGYDAAMLANLVFVTRPEGEIRDRNEAAEWLAAGLSPELDNGPVPARLIISFATEADRQTFVEKTGIVISLKHSAKVWTTWWPYRDQEDARSVRIVAAGTAMEATV